MFVFFFSVATVGGARVPLGAWAARISPGQFLGVVISRCLCRGDPTRPPWVPERLAPSSTNGSGPGLSSTSPTLGSPTAGAPRPAWVPTWPGSVGRGRREPLRHSGRPCRTTATIKYLEITTPNNFPGDIRAAHAPRGTRAPPTAVTEKNTNIYGFFPYIPMKSCWISWDFTIASVSLHPLYVPTLLWPCSRHLRSTFSETILDVTRLVLGKFVFGSWRIEMDENFSVTSAWSTPIVLSPLQSKN